MTTLRSNFAVCERARAYVSLAVDEELSELGAARLEAHLAECADCRAYSAEVGGLTAQLRSTELEQPETPFVLPRSRTTLVRGLQVGAAAAAVLAATLGGLSASHRTGQAASPAFQSASPQLVLDAGDELRPIRFVTVDTAVKIPAV